MIFNGIKVLGRTGARFFYLDSHQKGPAELPARVPHGLYLGIYES